MCFEQLPVEFTPEGSAVLKDGADWHAFRGRSEASARPRQRSGRARAFDIDPVTRVAGALAFHTEVDLERRVVEDARTEASVFRGYEVILRGREAIEAIHISSRACGVCGGVHATCAAMALEMAFGVVPPPLAVIARNLGEAAELLYDHTLHLFLLAGPDYSRSVVAATSPSLWTAAQKADAARSAPLGLATIADIMRGLDPLTGSLYREALEITRSAREIAALMLGKYPHPSTIFPGGVGTAANVHVFNQVLGRIVRLLDYAKKAAAVWDDLVEFFLAELPAYRQVGEREANLLCTGMWDDPTAYDASYRNAAEWGHRRLVTPGAIVDGTLRTTRLDAINVGVEEFVDSAYYERWKGDRMATDPTGAPLSPYHPWNKETIPAPQGRSWRERYTWGTAPRWDREAMESGPLARQWISAVGGKLVENEWIRAVPGGLEIALPRGRLPAQTLRWRIPERVNALERNRARAYHIGYCGMVAYTFLLQAFQYIRAGRTEMSTPYRIPKGTALGLGFWEAGRGTLMHFAELDGGKIVNYQIVTPSTWMASPRDANGRPGPYEDAVMRTPILEEYDRPTDFTGIDILRVIRSFDPCMPCTVHMHAGGRGIVRDATTCACGQEAAS